MANSGNKVLNMFAFLGLAFVAFALLLAQILGWIGVSVAVLSTVSLIGQCIAYIVTGVYAFFYVRSKRNIWWWVAYIVAVVVIIVMVVLPLF